VLHEKSVVAHALEMPLRNNLGILVAHADSVDDGSRCLVGVALGRLPGTPRQIRESHAGAQKLEVALDLLIGEAIGSLLFPRRPSGLTQESPGNISVVPEGTDHVGVECNKVAGPHNAIAALLKPGVSAGP